MPQIPSSFSLDTGGGQTFEEGFGGLFGWFIYFWRTKQFIPYFQRLLGGFSCGTPVS